MSKKILKGLRKVRAFLASHRDNVAGSEMKEVDRGDIKGGGKFRLGDDC